MCRLLVLKGNRIDAENHLNLFADVARTSKEYQGDGWGCSYWHDGTWVVYRSERPIWEEREEFRNIADTNLILAHARSAYDPATIGLSNNQPFESGDWTFIFNGLARGVRATVAGNTGAEKIFNIIMSHIDEGPENAIRNTISLIERRSRYIRALNFALSNGNETYVYCRYSEDPDYFAIRNYQNNGTTIFASEEYGPYSFRRINSNELLTIR